MMFEEAEEAMMNWLLYRLDRCHGSIPACGTSSLENRIGVSGRPGREQMAVVASGQWPTLMTHRDRHDAYIYCY